MKCLNKVLTIIGCITAAVAVIAAAFAVFSYFDKKRQDEELEEYLEGEYLSRLSDPPSPAAPCGTGRKRARP